uniref:Uncharacterized protein n=1 Tax=Romanomermis culicivorax TaxID=13658 RepID=A0A915HPC9_ROMCU
MVQWNFQVLAGQSKGTTEETTTPATATTQNSRSETWKKSNDFRYAYYICNNLCSDANGIKNQQ